MVDLWLSINMVENDDDMHVYLLEAAISYFNNYYKTNLRVNYNYKDHDSGDGEVNRILNAVALERSVSSMHNGAQMFQQGENINFKTKLPRSSST